MPKIVLKVVPQTESLMQRLEDLGLMWRFKPTPAADAAAPGETVVDTVYSTDLAYGSHKLICVGFNKSVVELGTHPDNEEFLLVRGERPGKPLILVVGLHRREGFQRRIDEGALSADDLVAMEMAFNDPALSFFIMYKDVPHCEWTVPGPGPSSVFFVTEPTDVPLLPVDCKGYQIVIERP